MLLELDNVSRNYTGAAAGAGATGIVNALQDVSIAVDKGQFVAVCGPSGCGKSTLLLLAGGLLRPDTGTVRIASEDPYAMAADARAEFRGRHVGFVFQQFHLVPYLSVLDNVLAPTLAVQFVDARERARQLLDQFGMLHRLHHVPSELSSGERQRTALARALLNRPQLILADEPTGNLDPENANAVLGFLKDYATDGGTVLLVTHDAAAAQRADRIIRMDQGRTIANPN